MKMVLELRTDDENDLWLKFMVSYSHFTLFILPIVMILLFELWASSEMSLL